MKRLLIDTDVILDVLLAREPFIEPALILWKAHLQGDFEGYISALTPVNVFYIARKLKGLTIARQAVDELLRVWQILSVDSAIITEALSIPLADYEDAVQHAAASKNQLDGIVTRNLEDYKNAVLPVYSPKDAIRMLGLGSL